MEPMVIDIAGTIKELVKWALMRVLLLLGLVVFGLSAPLLFTVGIEYLAFRGENMNIWAPIYFILGPFACCIWMVFICHWHSMRQWQRAGMLSTWRKDHGGIWLTVGKAVWFMVCGFFGSIVGEAVFLYGINLEFPNTVSRSAYPLTFAIAPLFVFAPVLLVLVSRWIRRHRCATV